MLYACKTSPDIAFILLLGSPRQNENIKEWRGVACLCSMAKMKGFAPFPFILELAELQICLSGLGQWVLLASAQTKDMTGTLKVGFGPGQVALGLQETAEIIEAAGGVGMLWPQHLLPDR